jgi:ABC-2 type transport system permease protein
MGSASALARRTFADARVRTIGFGLLFLVGGVTQATAYREGYPTLRDRIDFARSVGENDAARLLYGAPRDLLSVGGYVTWRVGGSMAVFAALWGLLGAVRAMRAEEDSGRADVLLAGVVGRRRALLAQLAGIGGGAAVLWLALFVSLLAGGLPAGGSAYLALAIVSVVPVFVGVGAVTSQLAPTRRSATGLAVAVLVVAFALRTVAALPSSGLGPLRWASPLGWVEELRPFAGPQPAVLLLPAVTAAVLLAVAAALLVRRDIGRGLLPARDTAPPRLALLNSPIQQAVRLERGTVLAWLAGVGAFALLMGVLADAVTPDVISEDVRRQLEKLGTGSVVTPEGWLGFSFVFLLLAVSLFCVMQVASLRNEEADQRLETLLALPTGRGAWLAGRLSLAAAAATVLALAAGACAWAGAASKGAHVSLPQLLAAGTNTLPPAFLFLAAGALAFALVPRSAVALGYGLVGLAFVWELFGSLLDVPAWLLAVSPFHDVGLVPGEPFEPVAAAIMLALAGLGAVAALWAFARRDLAAA